MYFNGIPQGFGQGQPQEPDTLMNRPFMGYTQGIGGLNPQNMPAPSSPAPQLGNISGPSSTAGTASKSIAPLQPYNKPMAGQAMASGGVVGQTLDKGGIVSGGIAALRGQHPDPRSALDAYDQTFGTDATSELIRSYADGGVVSGPGSGVADLVPGSIDGREDVRIASGEYVIPAWAVAALGDGSTEAGAAVLDDMVARLREAGSELIKGSEPIKPNEFLPA
jgi:hypothetical protein